MNPVSSALLILACVAGLLLALARFVRVYPHRALVVAAGLVAFLSLQLITTPAFVWPLMAIDAVIVIVAVADLCTVPRRRDLSAERTLGRIASLKKTHHASLMVTNHARRSLGFEIRDGVPVELEPDPESFTLVLAPRTRATLNYRLRSRRRGAFELTTIYVRARSRLAMWQRYLEYDALSPLFVYPDMKQLAQYASLARTNRLNLLGLHRSRRIGQDNEFERLRDYTPDDNYKHIDWRSTARRGKPTVKDFQHNQSQRVVFLVDCGRMMTAEAAGLTLLDHALNSMLMLSYVALSRGDSVGLLCFSDAIHAFAQPQRGLNHMNRLLHASFDQFPRMVESRYDRAFLYLAHHVRQRALVILVTNVIDEVNANQVEDYLSNLVGRHLPLGVLLRDRRVFEAADVAHPQGNELYEAAAAADVLTWRQQVLVDLESSGVLSLDVFPEDLTAPLINRYLDVKTRHLL